MRIRVAAENGVELVDVEESSILVFPDGLVGFEDLKRFVLFKIEDPLMLLQSADDPHVGFVVIDPFLVDPTYRVPGELACDALHLADDDSRAMLSIVSVSRSGIPVSVNLRAPVVINSTRRLGMQVILQEDRPVRHPIEVSADGGLVLPGAKSTVPEAVIC